MNSSCVNWQSPHNHKPRSSRMLPKTTVSDSTNAVFKDKPNKGLMCNYCANKKGSHSFANKRHCPSWGAVCSLCKIKNHFKDSKECKRLQKERKPKPGNQNQSRSTRKAFVLKVDEDGEEHFYEVVDKICTLNQQCDQFCFRTTHTTHHGNHFD